MFETATAAWNESVQFLPPSVDRQTWTSELGSKGEKQSVER
ncbi:MAG TPA: hypothetical protein VNO17_02050 [Actinomycetota bacterium]|nr:hypothetical protein [Actinomycetota bacterium]